MTEPAVFGAGDQSPTGEIIFLTFICQGPEVGAATLVTVLAGAQGLLDELDRSQNGVSTLKWCVDGMLFGFSEYDDIRRVAIELSGRRPTATSGSTPAGAGIYPALAEGLHQLRTAPVLPDGFPLAALEHVIKLADTLNGEISEMWFSQSGITPVFVTADTERNVREYLARGAGLPGGGRDPA